MLRRLLSSCACLTLLFHNSHAALAQPRTVNAAVGLPPAAFTSGGFCAPPALGAPCPTGGLATMGNVEPIPSLSIGNPVHLASGNKYQLEVDLPPNPSAPGLELVRHYNGLSTRAGPLGRNWNLSYDTRLQRRADKWWLLQADGSSAEIAPPLPEGGAFAVPLPDGRRLRFDAQGRLESIRRGLSTSLRIVRHTGPQAYAGLIKRVESGAARLDFHYYEQDGELLLRAVDSPLGRFDYHYEAPPASSAYRSARLLGVRRPDGMTRHYHYEEALQAGNPYALTGISLQAGEGPPRRLTTWKYDASGRVVFLGHHGRELPDLHLEYLQSAHAERPGITLVRSAYGQVEIRYRRFEDEYQVLQRHIEGWTHGEFRAGYDADGRLISIDGMHLQRSPGGELLGLRPQSEGWPGLYLQRDPAGGYGWYSDATGLTRLQADSNGRPASLHYANGDSLQLHYDAQGRPVRLEQFGAVSRKHYTTQLQWYGPRLQRVTHPYEEETRHYDQMGRLRHRQLRRPALFDTPAVQFHEEFHHDDQGRLQYHRLPEGGALHYRWSSPGRNSRLVELLWEDAHGQRHIVLSATQGRPGYRYSNGLALITAAIDGPHANILTLEHGERQLWRQTRHYDAHGRLLRDSHAYPSQGLREHLVFNHDVRSRIQAVLSQHTAGDSVWWYAWHGDGRLVASRQGDAGTLPEIPRDASGLPVSVDAVSLDYGPGRRLETVTPRDGRQAHYRYNAFGHRIVKYLPDAAHGPHASGASGAIHYLYLNQQLVAEARSTSDDGPVTVTRRYLYAGLTPVGMIDYTTPGEPQLYALHADLAAAVRMVTDQNRKVRWLATYSPTGQAQRVSGDLDLHLRLPGQYEDVETGWHDNLLRTYAPELGHYLEPDPLGPLPHTQAYGYAAQQPWRYADPLGLLLFAFDGTRYSADSRSNTWLLAQAYLDGPAHYHSGPGNSLYLDWDAVVAWRTGRILENQWQALLTSLERQPAGVTVPIDIIGFSRGASLARHFGNRIAAHMNKGLFSVDDPMRGRVTACVDLRFLGLFDTVSQFGIAGSHNHLYDFAVTEMWSWVAHAVALHEHRWTFPLTSADAGGAGNVVEVPLVGAHADIGGGLALQSPGGSAENNNATEGDAAQIEAHSDLAKIALAWMHWQAQAASVNFNELSEEDSKVQSPLLRDMRNPLMRTIQQGDRAILAPSGALRLTYQDEDARLGREARRQVESFISRAQEWRRQDSEVVGTIDMQAYARWLENTLGWTP